MGKHIETVEDIKLLPTFGEAGKLFVTHGSQKKLQN